MKNPAISRIMSRPLLTISPDDTVSAAQALLEQNDVHHLLVVSDGRMAGILSSADLLKLALLLQPQAGQSLADTAESLGIKVRDVMQVKVAVVRENTSLRDAARALALGGFHALPVLAIDDTPMGIVTSSDLLGLLIDGIDRDPPDETAAAAPGADRTDGLTTRLLEVLRAAEVYLHSGQSDQQHARLTRAVDRAREMVAAA